MLDDEDLVNMGSMPQQQQQHTIHRVSTANAFAADYYAHLSTHGTASDNVCEQSMDSDSMLLVAEVHSRQIPPAGSALQLHTCATSSPVAVSKADVPRNRPALHDAASSATGVPAVQPPILPPSAGVACEPAVAVADKASMDCDPVTAAGSTGCFRFGLTTIDKLALLQVGAIGSSSFLVSPSSHSCTPRATRGCSLGKVSCWHDGNNCISHNSNKAGSSLSPCYLSSPPGAATLEVVRFGARSEAAPRGAFEFIVEGMDMVEDDMLHNQQRYLQSTNGSNSSSDACSSEGTCHKSDHSKNKTQWTTTSSREVEYADEQCEEYDTDFEDYSSGDEADAAAAAELQQRVRVVELMADVSRWGTAPAANLAMCPGGGQHQPAQGQVMNQSTTSQ
jgi:hypothetical protein